MKNIFLIFIFSLSLNSCGFNLELEAYNFDNFKGTSLWELAEAVRADDANEVKEIIKNSNRLEIDLKDSKYQQTLLALAIQNDKRNAFLELLKAGANPNELLGNPKDATPFIYGIRSVENCDLFYVESMLKHGANPNLEIKNPTPEFYFENSYPLIASIGNRYNSGVECLDLIKLLVNNGADINCCYKDTYYDYCSGVIGECLISRSMETLKYFIIEKKITIPDTVIISGVEKSNHKATSLREELNSRHHKYEDFEIDGEKHDRSKMRKTRNEILEYLDKN